MTSSLDMIRGRSNIVTLTNKSGGALVAGDVCVLDTANDEAATTTTSAASVLKIYIAAESIASNAAGKFYSSGFCPLATPSASVTRGRYLFTHTVAKQCAESATYGAGAFGVILKSGTTPSVWLFGSTAQGSGGGVTRSGSTTDGHLAVWDGSNADSIKDGGVASAGALVLLEQHTASGGGTLDFTTFISATYDTYIFELVDVLPATNAVSFSLQMGTGGGPTFDTGANYGWGNIRYNSAGSAGAGSNADTSIIIAGNTDTISNDANYNGVGGFIRLYSPGGAAYKKVVGEVGFKSTNVEGISFNGFYQSTTAVTGIRFLFSSGNITSGTIRVYGVAK